MMQCGTNKSKGSQICTSIYLNMRGHACSVSWNLC